jgi:hypothetical protein
MPRDQPACPLSEYLGPRPEELVRGPFGPLFRRFIIILGAPRFMLNRSTALTFWCRSSIMILVMLILNASMLILDHA